MAETHLSAVSAAASLSMTETPESPTPESRAEPTSVTGQPRVAEPLPPYDDRYDRPNRLGQVLAWVGIIAGVVFIVAVIFFSGFAIGKSSGHHYGGHRGYHHSQMGPGRSGPGGMMEPEEWGKAQ